MNHRERIRAAFAGEPIDRAPMKFTYTPEFAARLADYLGVSISSHTLHGGGVGFPIEEALGEDMVMTGVGWAMSYYGDEPGAEGYTDEWGVGWKVSRFDTPFGSARYTEIAEHPLSDINRLKDYNAPDPERSELYSDAKAVISKYGESHFVCGSVVTTVFETAWALRGLEQLLVDFLIDEESADAVLDIPFRYHSAAAKRLVKMGVDVIWLGDDVGNQDRMMISTDLWRRFLKPRMAKLFKELKAINPGVLIAYHSCGFIEPIIPELIEMGLDILHPIQPASMDPAIIKEKFGNKLNFWGSIDEQHTLPFGTPDDVRNEVRLRYDTIGRDGGIIMAPSHHVQPDTPMENFIAMVEAIKEGK